MNSSLRLVLTLARHEYRTAVRSRTLLALLAILVTVTAVSVFIGAVGYRSQVADYEAYRAAAVAGGLDRIAPSPLRPLSLLRGALEYLEIIGAVIAIALGYLTVSRERANRTLALLRSRPVSTNELATGALLGALGVMTTLVVVTELVGVVCVGLVGNDWPSVGQLVQLLLATVAAILYMGVFYCVGAVATARSRVPANGLMAALGVWLVVVLILPQFGDTLDADNQIPGGLFRALGLGRDGEAQILTHFAVYEHIRVGLEEASFSKHYERFAFAMTDVLDEYRGFSLWHLLQAKHHDIEWLFVYPVAATWFLRRSFQRQPVITSGDQR